MSDTPRTDAILEDGFERGSFIAYAREIERELSIAVSALKTIAESNYSISATEPTAFANVMGAKMALHLIHTLNPGIAPYRRGAMKEHSVFNALGSYAPPPNIVPPPPPVRCNALLGACMYGVRPELPVRGFPPGKIRIRQRNTKFPSAFIKTTSGIRHFIIAEHDGHWVPYAEQGANHTPNPNFQAGGTL